MAMFNNKKEFFDSLRFDPNDLLDPRVCQGEKLVPNILKELGAAEDVINNPQLIADIKRHLRAIVSQKGVEMPGKFEQPTREQIEAIVEAIKASKPLTQEARNKRAAVHSTNSREAYYGLSIDSVTGSVKIQTLKLGRNDESAENYLIESTFSPDGKGDAIENSSYLTIDMNSPMREEKVGAIEKALYKRNGMVTERENTYYKGDRMHHHRIIKRDPKQPAIAHEVIEFEGGDIINRTVANEIRGISRLAGYEYLKDEHGNPTTDPITFKTQSEIDRYCEENEAEINAALTKAGINIHEQGRGMVE